MKTFLVLYYAPLEEMQKMKNASPEEKEADMKPWLAWRDKNMKSLVDFGGPVGKTQKITKSGVMHSHNEIGGYSIIQAETHDQASKIMQSNPHLDWVEGCYIEVCEIMEM